MSEERRAQIQPFTVDEVEFVCWVTAENTYEWRAMGGRLTVSRLGAHCRATCDGYSVTTHEPSLYMAMMAAVAALKRSKAA